MLPMLSGQLPNEFKNDYSDTPILIDTREQKPLYFKNCKSLKLDVGDYNEILIRERWLKYLVLTRSVLIKEKMPINSKKY